MGVSVTGGGLHFDATIDGSQFQAQINRMESDLNRITNKAINQGNEIENWVKKATSAATAFFSLNAAQGFISTLIDVRSQFQQLDIAFTTMLKSKATANALMKELVTFAAETPFGLKDAASAAKQLLAYGSTAKTVVGELRMLGDVASGVSVPIGDLVYLYGTLKTQGRAYLMDIRQFAGRGIPIYAELAKVLKVSKDEVSALVTAGKVGFPEIEQAFKNMTATGSMFGGLMEAQSKTWTGQIERFKDAWDVMLNEIGKSQEGLFATGISGLTAMVENYQSIIDIITVSVAAYGVYRTALLATAAFERVSTASKFGLALAVNQESVARIANAQALAVELRAEVSNLAIKKASATQAALNAVQSQASAVASLREAEAKIANTATNNVIAAQEKASIARKAALAATSQFYTAQQRLETLSKTESSAAELYHLRAQVSNLAVKKAAAIQAAINAAANVKVVESKVLEVSTEKVLAAQERVAITRKAALSASSEFYAAQQKLEATAKVANSAATVELTAVESLNAAGKRILAKATAAYNTVLAASPVLAFTAVITALGLVIYSLTQITNAAEESQRLLTESHEEGGKTADSQKRKIDLLIAVLKDETSTVEQKKAAYEKLQDTTEGVLKGYSLEEIAIGKAVSSLEDYIVKIREAASARKAFAEYNELADQMDALERQGISSISTWTRLGRSIQNTFSPTSKGLSFGEWANEVFDSKAASDRIVGQEKGVLQDAMDALKKEFGGKFNEIISGTDETSTSTVKKSRTVDVIDADIKKLKEEQTAVSETSAQYKKFQNQINALEAERTRITGASAKASREEDNSLKRKAEMLNKIFELNERYIANSLTDDEQKLQSIRNAYKALQRDIDIYNANPKNKKVNPNLKPALEKAIENQQYANDTKILQVELDKQKDLYQQYEENKVALGITAAEKIRQKNGNYFNEELAENKENYSTYLEYLEAQRAKLLDKDPMNMSGPELERLSDYNKRIDEQVKLQKEAYAVLLNDNSTYQQLKASATERYNKKISELAGNENAGRRAVLTKGYQDEVNHLSEAMLQKTDIYKKAAQEALILTRQETIKQIAALNNLIESGLIPTDQLAKIQAEISKLKFNLNIGVNEGNLNSLKDEFTRVAAQLKVKDENGTELILSDDDYKAIITRLAEIQTKIDDIVNPGTGKVKSNFAKGLEESFDYLQKGKGASDVAKGLSKDLSQLSSGFNELSGALGGNDTQAGYLLDTIGQLTKAGSDAAGAFASFASGDIIGGITKTMSAVTSIISIGRKVKEMNAAARKEVEAFYANAIAGEREYQDLLKQRELQTIRNNKIALQGIRDELKLRKSQNDEYAKEANEIMAKLNTKSFIASESYTHGTWFRKAKVNKTYSSLNGMGFEQLSQLLAQGKLEGDAKALVERLKELESKGYDAQQAITELARETSELFTGTTSSNLTNTLSQMFAEGKTSAADLADFFKQSMDDAALSIFKNKVLAGAMESFYAEFDKAAQSGDELTSDEIATLNGLFTSLTGDALKKFEEFKKITGSDLLGKSEDQPASGVSGKIVGEALTEGTANRMLGISIGQYDEIKRQGIEARAYFEMAVSNFQVQVRIEQNTLRTADNTDQLTRLKKIEENLDQIASNTKIDSGSSLDQLLRNGGIKA